jgi:hypothetical protein
MARPTERLVKVKGRVRVNVKFLTTENTGSQRKPWALDACFLGHLCWSSSRGGILKAFRRLLQRTPLYGAYKALGHYPDYWYWILRGRPSRSPHLLKQKVVRANGEKLGLKTLVETGTYYGEMVAAMKSRFDRIYSIEFVPALAARATRKFAGDGHVRIFCGDSRVVMPEVLALLKGPALFWLDAGYYGWVGKQGDQQRLSGELEMILSHPFPHVILLDDARGLTGREGIPSVGDVKAYVESTFPQRSVEVEYAIMRITFQVETA